ncbi:MAG TPA: single-stranded DNA-binding protein [Thermoanaerobaculia bacterium]
MASVNKVILVGRLGKDPEIRSTPSGQSVTKFTIATDERFTDRSGERQERTEWHNIVAWGKLAEICGQYLKKGKLVYIEGSIRTDSWDDKESGQKRYRTEIIANTMQMLDRREGDGGGGYSGGGGYGESRGQSPQRGGGGAARPASNESFGDDDEDVPF